MDSQKIVIFAGILLFLIFLSYFLPQAEVVPQINEEASPKLPLIKVAIIYEPATGNAYFNRSVEDVIKLLKETKTDFIFRGWWRWKPLPESPTDSAGFFPSEYLDEARKQGYTYEELKNSIIKIKREKPNVIFTGAIGAQFINAQKERNEITGEILDENKTWSMALDPTKWGLSMTKEELLKTMPGYGHSSHYYPDITNPEYKELFLSWAYKQIDSGVDAIWIDLLYTQADIFKGYALKYPNEAENAHRASKDSYEAASKIVDEIHNYGQSKYGKYIYVGTWAYPVVSYPYTKPKLDFVTNTISPQEVFYMQFEDNRWNNTITDVNSQLGNISIFAILDWDADIGTGLGVFSQKLSSDKQKEFLKKADEFFTKRGIIFIYPVHGGNMGEDAKKISFGKFKIYDSIAPEFLTYETIKNLAQGKSK